MRLVRVAMRLGASGIRVHCSEEYLPIKGTMCGPLRNKLIWTPALQAEYLPRYLTVTSEPTFSVVYNFTHPK